MARTLEDAREPQSLDDILRLYPYTLGIGDTTNGKEIWGLSSFPRP